MIEPHENFVEGKWIQDGQVVKEDAVCDRIRNLAATHLEKICTDTSGWDTLYKDPIDGRYWELVYLHNELYGGGPPSLRCLTKEDVQKKYGIG